jgi:hypothetical protein
MKKHKIYLLLLLISLCLILLCSCRCDPAECQWYLLEMTDDLSFANGVTEKLTISGALIFTNPLQGLTPSAVRSNLMRMEDSP